MTKFKTHNGEKSYYTILTCFKRPYV